MFTSTTIVSGNPFASTTLKISSQLLAVFIIRMIKKELVTFPMATYYTTFCSWPPKR